MTRILFTLTLLSMIVPLATAQDNALQYQALREKAPTTFSQPKPLTTRDSNTPPFCPPKSCLYYAGDFDWTDSNSNGQYNANETSNGVEGQVWVGVKPTRDVLVTGGTFVQIFNSGVGTNPTPFAIQVGIKPGQAGTTVCSTTGNAVLKTYQEFNWGNTYSYTINKLSKPCRLKKGTTYYVNLLFTSDTGYGYLLDVEDARPANHQGWKNILDNSYFNGAAFGASYQPTWGSGGSCQGLGCDAFSIALTGKATK